MLIDAHAHVDRYDDALESALGEITESRILTISNSMDLPSYKRNLEIAKRCSLVVPVFGIHPWNAPRYVDHLEAVTRAIEESPMIGEIGLDHHFVQDASQWAAQREVLVFFLVAAGKQEKIVSLHTKGAEVEILALLDRHDIRRAIVHWYSGPLDVFHALVARRVYFTIGVEVLYSQHVRTIARELPWEALLTETDNPGGLRSLAGTVGMPLVIKDVIQALAELREATDGFIIQTVQGNFLRLIRDDPRLSGTYAAVLHNNTVP